MYTANHWQLDYENQRNLYVVCRSSWEIFKPECWVVFKLLSS